MKNQKSDIKPYILLVLLTCAMAIALAPDVRAIQTEEVEIGKAGLYDGAVKIARDDTGRMTLSDNDVQTPVTLNDLRYAGRDHGLLLGLGDDDHPQYLTTARHDGAHTASYNNTLAILADIDGNLTLGAHLLDSKVHLNRQSNETIGGAWSFTGVPSFTAGLDAIGGLKMGANTVLDSSRNLTANDLAMGADGGGNRTFTMYSSVAGKYGQFASDGTQLIIKSTGINVPLVLTSVSSYARIRAAGAQDMFLDAGGLVRLRDADAGFLDRLTLDTNNGALNIGIGSTGGLSLNGVEVISSARALTATSGTVNGDLAIGVGGNKLTLNGQRLLNEVNLLDNPDFTIWQRNITQVCASGGDAGGTLTRPQPGTLLTGADRWQIARAKTDMSSTVSRATPPGSLPTTQYCLKNDYVAGNPNCWQYLYQTVPREVTAGLRGKWVTFAISHYLDGTSGGNIAIYKVIGGAPTELIRSSFTSTANTWERLAVTAQVPTDAETLLVSIQSNLASSGAHTAYIANAALVEGRYVSGLEKLPLPGDPSVPPLPNRPADDLTRCQRYFEKGSISYTNYAPDVGAIAFYTTVHYNTAKASASTVTISNLQTGPLTFPTYSVVEQPAYLAGQSWPHGFTFSAGGQSPGAVIVGIAADWQASCPEPL